MPGRNDPCPCGSGKKYKKCCLLKEMQEEADQRQDVPSTDAWTATPPDLPEEVLDTPHFIETTAPVDSTPEPDPLVEAMNEWWEVFSNATGEEQWEIVEEVLWEAPELMDGEMLFEVGTTLFQTAIAGGEWEQFDRVLDLMEQRVPAAYQAELAYILDWRLDGALVRQDWPAVEALFIEYSRVAGSELDLYYRQVNALAYHGRLDTLVRGMWQALPDVEESDELLPWAAGKFAEKLGTYELLRLLEENPQLTAEDPELRERFAELDLTVVPEDLDEVLRYRSGREQVGWSPDELILSPGVDFTDDPGKEKLALLLLAWTHYAHAEEGVPRTKAEMARRSLYRYFVKRSEGELEGDAGPSRRPKRRRKSRLVLDSAQNVKTRQVALVPERRTLDRFLVKMAGFFSSQYHQAVALFELLPVWLRFLKQHGLVDEKVEAEALQDLAQLRGQLLEIVESQVNDPALARNLKAWRGT